MRITAMKMIAVGGFHRAKLIKKVRLKIYQPLFRLFCTNLNSLKAYKVLFYGTDALSEVTLNALNNNRLSPSPSKVVKSLDIVCIKTDCRVRRYAELHNLTVHTWPYDVPVGVYDVGIVVSFGHLIPSESILACKYGIINAHPSLLPRWRGAAPIFHTILNGDAETGVTITEVSAKKFDIGKIIMQEKFDVPEECSSKLLTDELSKIAAKLVLKTLENLPHYLELSYPQPSEGVTYARKIKPELGCINWEHPVLSIYRKFKAFDGFDGWFGITVVKIPKRGKITALDFYNGFMSKEIPKNCYFFLNKNPS
ncbi:methionyl-tRNA formyltransferase, mitochondrial-like isoform X2 [Stegodyphus dumicola]|uniref:methionyl-tRNA formyltransferase, mitochondrial-like isoform X2 n=1 Tax=Stegodyphus dumicola TaxID=202533 RepID=UPI0015ABD184|nr:methionyl-tRNA formyltransferase, mitochondrial-like isoform X2 [Stegodyphus dumicola]